MNHIRYLVVIGFVTAIGQSWSLPALAAKSGVSINQYLIRNEIAKACFVIVIDETGNKSIEVSSGNKQLDQVALKSWELDRMVALASKQSSGEIATGKRRLPIDFDLSSTFKKGRVYCPQKAPSPAAH